ncbi:InlB B-repeat-containing protein [Holdemania massiliensis]|uniref:InlB B-repeat-containing protein n=1 Tax=Holdemania massiliensis TaxID=1468449 RepID=UPI001563BD25
MTRWTWTWPDNTKTEGINTKVSDYTFTTAGKNTVTLNVQYDDGRENAFSHDIIVSKYQPKVDITSGNGIADFTAKVGDVGDRNVIFYLPRGMPKSIQATYSIGQVSVTGECYSSTFGGNDFLCGAARLNSLPAGDYPIKLSSPGSDQVEGFDLTLGTAHIEEKYQPKVDIIGGDGSADFTAKVGDVGNRDVDFRLPPDIPKSIEVTYSIGQVRVTDNISFGQYKQTLDSADLNNLPAGDYPIKLSSPGNDQVEGFDLTLGTAHIEKYQLKVDIRNNSDKDFTAKVGDVGDRIVFYNLRCEKMDGVEVTYSIGSLTSIHWMAFDVNDGRLFYQGFLETDLNNLSAGDYPIKLSSPGNERIEGFDLTLGTAHIEKYQLKVVAISGNGGKDFTAKVGNVGDRHVIYSLLCEKEDSVEVTHSIGSLAFTWQVNFGVKDGKKFTQYLSAADLNSLPAGDYPIKLSSPGNERIEGFDLTLGTAHIEKYKPVFADNNHSARYAGDSADLQLMLISGKEGYPETISYTVTISDKVLMSGQINAYDDTPTFSVGGLNFMNLIPGIYDIKLKSEESEHNQSVQTRIGTLTVAGVTGVEIMPSASIVEKGGTLQFDADVKNVSTSDCPVEDTVIWAVSGNHSSKTVIDAMGRLSVGADESADTLTIQAESVHENGLLGKVKASTSVTVLPPAVTGLTVSPASVTVSQGKQHQFRVSVAVVSGADNRVQWTVEGSRSAKTKIDTAGLMTVGPDESADVLTIRATSMFDTKQSGTAQVKVTKSQPANADPAPDPVYSLTIQAGAGGTIITGTNGSYPAESPVSLQAQADAGYEFAGWSSSNGGRFTNSGSLSTTFTMPAQATVVTAVFQKKNSVSHALDYTDQTLTDPSGVRVSGLFTDGAVLEAGDKLPHLEGDCDGCDGIRERQKKGELIILFDLSLKSGKYKGELQVEIPVGETYSGQTVEILHCHEKVLESRTVTVQNGMAAGTFSSLSPYAVFKVQASAEVTGLPESYTLMTGETVSWTPVPAGGVWSCDSDLLEMTASGDTCTFKALKKGTAAITYTVDDAAFTITLTVHSSAASQPNALSSVWLWALLAAGLLGCTALVTVKRNSGKKRNG